VRTIVHSPNGTLKLAAVYGPAIWLWMYFIVLPIAGIKTGSFATWSFALMLLGHIISVGWPIIGVIGDGGSR
jgi:hypothetical protein